MSYFETNIARIASPLFANDFSMKVRKFFVAICLVLIFVSWSFERNKQFVEDFESSVSGLIQILTSDLPHPPKPIVPKPPSFAFTKGLGQSGLRP